VHVETSLLANSLFHWLKAEPRLLQKEIDHEVIIKNVFSLKSNIINQKVQDKLVA